ncbi:MAG TPA: TRAP transporter small permease [Hyphomonadaceae bacterium]|nr:TRAP transporter small permease [Hyphomonadaceae bacterium]
MTEKTGKSGEKGRKGVLDRLEWLALLLAGVSLVAVVVVQAWQVFARYVLNASPSWTEPLALVFIATTAMLGAAVGARRETHFGFPLLADAASPPIRAICRALARLAMSLLGAGLAVFATILMKDTWNVAMAGAGVPVGLRFLPMAVGGALIAVFGVERLVEGLRERGAEAPEAVRETT